MVNQLLRDLRKNTELLILVEILKSPSIRLKDLADTFGITVQAVSQYVSAMKREGLLRHQSGVLRPTRKGMQMAQERLTNLKEHIDQTLRRIAVIDVCVAIAAGKVAKGQSVGLEMEDGILMAFREKEASSTGVALESAEEGDDVIVGQLEGIVDLKLGQLLVVEAPSEYDGGSKTVDLRRLRERLESFSPGLLAAGDLVGAALLSKVTEEMFTIHAPVESAMSALSKGVDVVFCGTRASVEKIIQAVAELKRQSGYAIDWKSFKA